MSLTVGQTLSHYEILGTLGAGGMGEVYRARDTRLGREVAIKVLPEAFLSDEDRLRRFEREAKVLASLNHPNIDAIHGIDQEADICFLVLELVSGESLAERLARGPLPVPEAIDVCRQIAQGLEVAHEAGIVHRDLKPANVRITPEGVVKVLDFGLAKPRVGSASGGATSGADPDSFLMTQEGLVLGTPTYMSPEQARGRPVDRRTDIWAFGCVLFECLTGARAFPGSGVLEVLATIQEDEPDWSRLPAKTPPHVVHLLRRTLEKDPRRRLRDIGEARLALESPTGAVPTFSGEVAPAEGSRSGSLPWVLLALAVAFSVWAWNRPHEGLAPAPREVTRFQVDFEPEKRSFTDQVTGVTVSPDGRTLAVSLAAEEEAGVYVRDLDALEARRLTEEVASDVCFSPDGRWIAYLDRSADQLRRVRVDGGNPLTIAAVDDTTGISWSPQGFLAFSKTWGEGMSRLSVETGELAELARFEPQAGERNHIEPFFLPGGDVLLFAVWTGARWEEARIVALDVASGVKKVLPVNGTSPGYVPLGDGTTGALLWAITSTLWAQRFDPRSLELLGDPVQVLDGVRFSVGSGQARYDVSESGTLAYVPGDLALGRTRIVMVDRGGAEEPVYGEAGPFQAPSLSRDGRRATFVRSGPVFQVCTLDLGRPVEERRMQRLTFDDDAYQASISPDGRTVAYVSNPGGEYKMFLRPFDGSTPARAIFPEDVMPRSWSSDGRKLAFHEMDEKTGNYDLWYLSLDDSGQGELEAHPLLATRLQEYDPQISPDDRWVAYIARGDDGKYDIHVASFPGGAHVLQLTRGGASAPRWSPDGSELYYRVDQAFYAVKVQTEPSFSAGPPEKLFEGVYGADEAFGNDYAVAPDGRFLLLAPIVPENEELSVVVVENWVVELERKLR